MISLFGRKEFDPPGERMKDPRTAVNLSGLYLLLALLWLAISLDRVSHRRSSGEPVGWHEAAVCFWVVMLLFWLWNWWNNRKRYRAQRKEWDKGEAL